MDTDLEIRVNELHEFCITTYLMFVQEIGMFDLNPNQVTSKKLEISSPGAF